MSETERDDLDALAGEYVLGTLSPEERLAAEARLRSDPAFRTAAAAWETRLQPVADALPETMPARDLMPAIAARIAAAGGIVPSAGPDLGRTLRRWRTLAGLATAAAALLAGVVVFDRLSLPPRQSEFVAVLTAEGAKPAFVATVNVDKGTISIRRVATAAPPDKSYELWSIAPNAAPKSLGVVENVNYARDIALPAGDVTLAISLEPKGGSPTGAPTGPVVFSGALVPTE